MARKREFDKDAVLEKAMFLFWEKGFEATSIRDLKQATGISSSSMYETFGDKRNIFLQALKRYCELELRQFTDMAQQASDVKQFIRELFGSLDEVVTSGTQNYGSMTFNTMAEFGMRDADVTDLLFTHYLAIADHVAEMLAQAQSDDTISTQEDPRHLAHVILSTLQGLATIKSMKPDFPYGDAFQQVMLRILET